VTLSIVGRKLLSHQPLIPAQDPENLDRFVYLAHDSTWKIWSIVWGEDPTMLCDLGTLLDGQLLPTMCVVANNSSTFLGTLDETPHFAFCFFKSNLGVGADYGICDVNMNTGAYTVHYPFPTAHQGIMFDGKIFSRYEASGTVFFCSAQYTDIGNNYIVWGKKRYGEVVGEASAEQNTNVPASRDAVFMDEINRLSYFFAYAGYYYQTILSNFQSGGLPYSGSVLPAENADLGGYGNPDWISHTINSPVPAVRRMWDDNYLYGFGQTSHGGPAVYELFFFKKNLVTGAYVTTRMLTLPAGGSGNGTSHMAFDIWQPGSDTTKRRMFYAYFRGEKVHSSLVSPAVDTDSIAIDNAYGVGVSNPAIVSLHTADEYVYAFHSGGNLYGNCLTKIMETENIAPDEGTVSIGGIGARLLFKDKRVFFIGVPNYGKYLWWAQPMEPQSLDVGWDGYNTTVFDDEDNTSLNALDDSIYVGSQKGFIRLRGKSPDSWVLDQTLATTGPLSDKTSSVTPFGLIYPRENGLWLFNGFTSVLFFEKGKNLLTNVNWDEYARAFSLWDGRYYRLYYPSGSAIENDRELVIDLIGGIENARGTEGDRAATFGFADLTTNTVYLGDASGNLMTLGGTVASRAFSLSTKEYPCGPGLMDAGTFAALHYDIDLAGATLSIIPICDGVEKTPITITNTTRTRSKVSLPKGNFYRMGFRFEVTTDAAVKFYDPWYIE